MSLFGEYGASKIGSTIILQLAAGVWTESVLTILQQNRVSRSTSFVVKAAGTIYAFQANHALTINGAAFVPPLTPNSALGPANQPGYFELLQDVPWRIDVESPGENSLWMYATALTVVRITEITQTSFDAG